MTTRREMIRGTASLLVAPLLSPTTAQAVNDSVDALPPLEMGKADFSGIWVPNDPDVKLVAAAPDLPPEIAEAYVNINLTDAASIDSIFRKVGGESGFIAWFNKNVAGKPYWEEKSIPVGNAQEEFSAFWDQFLSQNSLNLLQFIAYMAIFINEVNGRLVSTTEAYGYKGHPGISYLFDTVTLIAPGSNRSWTKRSYNTGRSNQSAGRLFNDSVFNKFHGFKPLGDKLAGTDDAVWLGSNYPLLFPTAADPNLNGYILGADFFKFRGRGLIQTTWRKNYSQIVEWMFRNGSASDIVSEYVRKWQGLSTDTILTASITDDWDRLFNDDKKAVLCAAVQLHDAPWPENVRLYSNLSGGPTINGKTKGSLVFMGKSIGGSEGYGNLLKGRVRQICLTLGSV